MVGDLDAKFITIYMQYSENIYFASELLENLEEMVLQYYMDSDFIYRL